MSVNCAVSLKCIRLGVRCHVESTLLKGSSRAKMWQNLNLKNSKPYEYIYAKNRKLNESQLCSIIDINDTN